MDKRKIRHVDMPQKFVIGLCPVSSTCASKISLTLNRARSGWDAQRSSWSSTGWPLIAVHAGEPGNVRDMKNDRFLSK